MNRHSKIDWSAAKVAYVTDPGRTFAKIARRFGVSDVSVRNHANRDRWNVDAARWDREAEEKALRVAARTRDEHITQVLTARDRGWEQIVAGLTARTLDFTVTDAVQLGKYAELLQGQPTDRTDWQGEVRELVSVLLVRVSTLIEPAKRQAYLELIRELEGQLPAPEGEAP